MSSRFGWLRTYFTIGATQGVILAIPPWQAALVGASMPHSWPQAKPLLFALALATALTGLLLCVLGFTHAGRAIRFLPYPGELLLYFGLGAFGAHGRFCWFRHFRDQHNRSQGTR